MAVLYCIAVKNKETGKFELWELDEGIPLLVNEDHISGYLATALGNNSFEDIMVLERISFKVGVQVELLKKKE